MRIPNYAVSFPKTFVKIDRVNQKLIERDQTFYDKLKQFLDYIREGFERESGIIFYLSDNSSVVIDFQEVKEVVMGGDYFMFIFKDDKKRSIGIKESSILYFEIVPLVLDS